MPRQKKAEEQSAGSPWLNTFADLMNLLLCFFVLLFAFSTVDADKYEQLVRSMSAKNSIIFQGGSTAIDKGQLINNGVKQLDYLSDYTNNVGHDETITENESSTDTDSSKMTVEEIDKLAEEEILKKNKAATQKMYDKISYLAENNKVNDAIELSIDPNYQYIKISLNGSVLFDSGKAEIKSVALPIISKVGDILSVYKDYQIEIEGHTDNVPIHNSTYSSNNWLSSARALNAAMYLVNEKGLNPKTLRWTGRGEYDPIESNSTAEGRAKNRRVEIKIYNK